MTDADWHSWLLDPGAHRCVLFEAGVRSGGVETTRYFSTVGYTTAAAATPASTSYPGIATGGLQLAESIGIDGNSALTVGDIAVANADGERDGWLADIWTNRPVKAFLGDVRWPRADFRQVFAGVVADIGSGARDTLNLILTNKLARLNTAVSEKKHGGEATYSQVGTTVTVTRVAHNRAIGSVVQVDAVLTGTLVKGDYIVLGTTTDAFTFTAADAATSGTLRLGGINGDATLPLVFGEAHNVTPLLIDAARLRYSVHAGQVENIYEVRDNGIPVTVSKFNSYGFFELVNSPAGAITATVQGDKAGVGYALTVGQLVQRLATAYGTAAQRFVTADLDTASLAAFDAAHPQPVGLPLADRDNVLARCQELAATLGSSLVVTRAGQLRLVQLNFPPTGTPVAIAPSTQIERSLQIVARATVAAAVKLNYCKNWTVQEGLQTAIPAQHKELYATEWLSVTAKNATVAQEYHLTAEPVAVDTLLLARADAQAEAERRLAIVSAARTTYRFDGTAAHLALELGQAVTLTANRFGLDAGQLGVVTSLAPDWQNCRVTVEVTI